ncbi:MAG: hypothetical protein ACK4RV_02975 [Caulobacter sp.]|jgi:hypothetical protein
MTETKPGVDRVLIDLTISAPASEVWAALREPAKVLRWFGWDADSLPAEVDFIFVQYARADEAAGVLHFEGTSDRFEVIDEGDTSRLRVVRAAAAESDDWDDVYEDMTEGWITFVQQLRFALERHALAPRRTLFFTAGRSEERTDARPLEALGLSDLTGASADQTWARDLPTGDSLRGRVWHASSRQIGLTVDEWGEGLLVVHDAGAWSLGGGHGAGMAVLTTYGLDEAAFQSLELRWTRWWRGRFG